MVNMDSLKLRQLSRAQIQAIAKVCKVSRALYIGTDRHSELLAKSRQGSWQDGGNYPPIDEETSWRCSYVSQPIPPPR
ncbi:hypothetical protein SERLA73DRAFT_133695 [Serpula lacrymans var. lacrymans S7.3]|uniref:Uncharacterized protein n=1 Tax=Serpula lacrymans var. lacrymans (strain S7.3) TaxID=936435 RepID=F8PS88_SERL3|nr:hypothetical protein SERLA73DRAFT_133695 [Serpula lacrymans var. lacrymans S7.3]